MKFQIFIGMPGLISPTVGELKMKQVISNWRKEKINHGAHLGILDVTKKDHFFFPDSTEDMWVWSCEGWAHPLETGDTLVHNAVLVEQGKELAIDLFGKLTRTLSEIRMILLVNGYQIDLATEMGVAGKR